MDDHGDRQPATLNGGAGPGGDTGDTIDAQASLADALVHSGVLELTVDCVKLISVEGRLLQLNGAGRRALGVPAGAPLGMPWLSLLPADSHDAGQAALELVRGGRLARFAGSSVTAAGVVQHWDNLLTPVLGRDGAVESIVCVSRDTTSEHAALASLRLSQERLTKALQVGGMGVWDYDVEHDDLQCDAQWYRIMGRDPDLPVHSLADFEPFIHPADRERATEVADTGRELIAAGEEYAIVFRIVRPDGEVRWVRSAAHLHESGGVLRRAVGFVIDITDARRGELAREAERTTLARQIIEDPLTGIANRRHLDQELLRLCTWAHESAAPICIGMVDVDHFKAYNDRYGHLAGDEALRRIAATLAGAARRSDVVARYGGEEFVFVLAGTDDPVPMLERLFTSIAELAIEHDRAPGGRLTISCGCVCTDGTTELEPSRLLRQSDEALYSVKSTGRGGYAVTAYRLP